MDKKLDKEAFEQKYNEIVNQQLDSSDPEETQATEDEQPLSEGVQSLDVGEEASQSDDIDLDAVDEDDEDSATSSKKSKAEAAIVALKRKLKEKEEENRKLRELKSKALTKNNKEDLVKKYLSQGYDDDTAKHMAQQEYEIIVLKERADVADFKEEYSELISAYPESRKRIPEILNTIAVTGWTAEQVMRAMYYKPNPMNEKNISAVSGEYQSRSGDNAIGTAERTSSMPNKVSSLSQKDKESKAKFEEIFKSKISNERFLELKQKYDL